MATFEELGIDPSVLSSLEKIGYHSMTPIQEQAIPLLLTGQDFLGQAPTGTGKTAAFAIPLLSRLSAGDGPVEALIICPTRELAQQITEEINRIGQDKGVQALALYGGENVFVQKEALRTRNARIIVGTPGRLLDHVRQVSLNLTQTRLVILDEADEMLDMGFRPDIEDLFKNLPGGRETWLFSATLSPDIRKIAEQYMMYPNEVKIQAPTHTADNIQQFYLITTEEEKHRALRKILKDTPELYGLIFCQTKRDVVLLTRKLRDYFPVDCIHGAMEQSERDKVLDQFRSGELKLIVATDIVARGIDVDDLTHVINHSPPTEVESYIHRVGRTARKGTSGIAITLFTPGQEYQLTQLAKRIRKPLEKHPDSNAEFSAEAAHAERNARFQSRSGSGPQRHGGRPHPHQRSGRHYGPPPQQQGEAQGQGPSLQTPNEDGSFPPRPPRKKPPFPKQQHPHPYQAAPQAAAGVAQAPKAPSTNDTGEDKPKKRRRPRAPRKTVTEGIQNETVRE
jgi:ATP-dependent RNA helicase DeaD